jgi:hypothetical protein
VIFGEKPGFYLFLPYPNVLIGMKIAPSFLDEVWKKK